MSDELNRWLITAVCHLKTYFDKNGVIWTEGDEKCFQAIRVLIENGDKGPEVEDKKLSLLDLRGIAPDLTGDLSSEDFVRKVRSGEIGRLEVDEEFIEILRDRLMAIRIHDYYSPNPRQAIFNHIKEEFIKHGVPVKEKP